MAFMNNLCHPLFSNNGGHCISKQRTDAWSLIHNIGYHTQPIGTNRHRDVPRPDVWNSIYRSDTLTFLVESIDGFYFSIWPWSENIDETSLLCSCPLWWQDTDMCLKQEMKTLNTQDMFMALHPKLIRSYMYYRHVTNTLQYFLFFEWVSNFLKKLNTVVFSERELKDCIC